MQVNHPVTYSAEYYAQIRAHEQVRPRARCPSCGREARQHGHGVYERWVVSRAGLWLRIAVARFLCTGCGVTTSYLPSFALCYRPMDPASFEAYLLGQHEGLDVLRCWDTLRRYQRQMEAFGPKLVAVVGHGLGLAPPTRDAGCARAVLGWLLKACGSLGSATGRLVETFRHSVFGPYTCHQKRNSSDVSQSGRRRRGQSEG
jgi:transposase-like protein